MTDFDIEELKKAAVLKYIIILDLIIKIKGKNLIRKRINLLGSYIK